MLVSFCLCPFLFLCLPVCLSLSVGLYLYICLCLLVFICLRMCVSFWLYLSVRFSVCLSVFICLLVFICISVYVCMSLSVYLFFYLSLSLSVSIFLSYVILYMYYFPKWVGAGHLLHPLRKISIMPLIDLANPYMKFILYIFHYEKFRPYIGAHRYYQM